MTGSLAISIILCSCNRAASLRETLDSLGRVKIRPNWQVELLLVDNASTDETGEVMHSAKLDAMEVRYIYEARCGKGFALNTGISHAQGDFLFFTDDDVRIPEDWLEAMVEALNDGCDAITGRITLAPHLLRPWLTSRQRWWLASSDDAELKEGSRELIGANMGFHRHVLERVPAFDTELGPGALGLGEDTLFGWQLVEAGFTIRYAPQAAVTHHLSADRLQRKNLFTEARNHGQAEAYLLHHWEHQSIPFPRLKWLSAWLKLTVRGLFHPARPPDAEGCAKWETGYIHKMAWAGQFCVERRQRRKYPRRGLVKLSAGGEGDASSRPPLLDEPAKVDTSLSGT